MGVSTLRTRIQVELVSKSEEQQIVAVHKLCCRKVERRFIYTRVVPYTGGGHILRIVSFRESCSLTWAPSLAKDIVDQDQDCCVGFQCKLSTSFALFVVRNRCAVPKYAFFKSLPINRGLLRRRASAHPYDDYQPSCAASRTH